MSEVDLTRVVWRKSSRSNTAPRQCVELADTGRKIAVRDSKHPAGPKLAFACPGWAAFARDVKYGTFDA